MSSMYNLMFGVNKAAPVLLAMLGIDTEAVPRFRDCFLLEGNIVIHTRTGGGNRADYEKGNAFLQSLPGYIKDVDDSFDNTYANFYFQVPEKFKPLLNKIPEGEDPAKRWQKTLTKLRTAQPDDPLVKRVMAVLAPVFNKIKERGK